MTWPDPYRQHYQPPPSDLDSLASAAGSANPHPSASAPRPVAGRSEPDYAGIRVGAGILAAFGWLMVAVGTLALIAAGVAWAKSRRHDDLYDPSDALSSVVTLAAGGVAMLSYGISSLFVASLGMAVRDIARNSFRR